MPETAARKAGGLGALGSHTGNMAALVPLAHAGHWLWVLYLPPLLIVLGSLLRATLSERRKRKRDRLEDLG